jgi:hypothetical protein
MKNRTVTVPSYISLIAFNVVKLPRIRVYTWPGRNAKWGRAKLVDKSDKT